jgi:hypothetical protein
MAEGQRESSPDPQSLARGGTSVVSGDGFAALAANPGALARRSTLRLEVGTLLEAIDLIYRPPDGAPAVENQAPARLLPFGSIIWGWDRLVVGVGAGLTTGYHVATRQPRFDQDPVEIAVLYPHRHAGLSLRLERLSAMAGAGMRLAPWLALGAALAASRVELDEQVRIWSGAPGSDPGFSPSRDLHLALTANAVVPAVRVGALLGPESLPLELGVALSYRPPSTLQGRATLAATGAQLEPTAADADSSASVRLPGQLEVHSGGRLDAGRVAVELGAGLHLTGAEPVPAWQFALAVADQAGESPIEFVSAPSAVRYRDHLSARAAVEVELASDFLWLVGGYGYDGGSRIADQVTPTSAELPRHTVSLGAEGHWNDITVAVGYRHGFRTAEDSASSRQLLNAAGGDTLAVGSGRYRRGSQQFAIAVEIAWEPALFDLPSISNRSAHPQNRSAHPQNRSVHPQNRSAHPQNRSAHPQNRSAHPADRSAHRSGGGSSRTVRARPPRCDRFCSAPVTGPRPRSSDAPRERSSGSAAMGAPSPSANGSQEMRSRSDNTTVRLKVPVAGSCSDPPGRAAEVR